VRHEAASRKCRRVLRRGKGFRAAEGLIVSIRSPFDFRFSGLCQRAIVGAASSGSFLFRGERIARILAIARYS